MDVDEPEEPTDEPTTYQRSDHRHRKGDGVGQRAAPPPLPEVAQLPGLECLVVPHRDRLRDRLEHCRMEGAVEHAVDRDPLDTCILCDVRMLAFDLALDMLVEELDHPLLEAVVLQRDLAGDHMFPELFAVNLGQQD